MDFLGNFGLREFGNFLVKFGLKNFVNFGEIVNLRVNFGWF